VNDIILLSIISLPYFRHLSLDRQNKDLLPSATFELFEKKSKAHLPQTSFSHTQEKLV
jgi:hypothetical protein